MAKAAAKTGSGPTALVAVEQSFPAKERIIEDDLAYQLLPPDSKAFASMMGSDWTRDWLVQTTEREAPGIWAGMMCRKR